MKNRKIWILYILMICCVVFVAFWVKAESNNGKIEEYLKNGEKAMEDRKFDLAKTEYKKVIALEPRNFSANFALGKISMIEGAFSKAVEYLETAREVDEEKVKSDPKAKRNGEVMFWLGNAYVGLEKFNDAITKYQFALMYGYVDNLIYRNMAICYASAGQKEQAVKMGDKYLTEKGLSHDTALEIVSVYASAGYYPEALKVAQSINHADVWFMLGYHLVLKEQYETAVPHLENAVKLKEENHGMRFYLGLSYYQLYKMNEAVAQLSAALEQQPKNPDYLGALAFLYAEMGTNLEEAEKLCKEALLEAPGDAGIRDDLGWIYFKQGKYDLALEELGKAAVLAPNDANAYYHMACVYYKQKNTAKAKEMLKKTETLFIEGKRLKADIARLKKDLGM